MYFRNLDFQNSSLSKSKILKKNVLKDTEFLALSLLQVYCSLPILGLGVPSPGLWSSYIFADSRYARFASDLTPQPYQKPSAFQKNALHKVLTGQASSKNHFKIHKTEQQG
uniref:Uncharacterized protein n=1 Tax=Pyxicephalus adspersus TaxID=30357 RepID=A0AAV3A670_PYXAD|nr:TPA: hypothetical protein GDO54_013052 [Pyxicephalus adspersus]